MADEYKIVHKILPQARDKMGDQEVRTNLFLYYLESRFQNYQTHITSLGDIRLVEITFENSQDLVQFQLECEIDAINQHSKRDI